MCCLDGERGENTATDDQTGNTVQSHNQASRFEAELRRIDFRGLGVGGSMQSYARSHREKK
jgi:hypothetical protein